MTTDSISGLSSALNLQSFGSQVVSSTLDTMNGQSSSSNMNITDKDSFGAAVVGKTLDYMNSGSSHQSDMAQTYEFNKDVLGGYASGLGAVADLKV